MSKTDSWRLLRAHAEEPDEIPHLRELLADPKRCEKLFLEHDGIVLDYARQASARAGWLAGLALAAPLGRLVSSTGTHILCCRKCTFSPPARAARHRAHHEAAA
jgi:hypothetical protein